MRMRWRRLGGGRILVCRCRFLVARWLWLLCLRFWMTGMVEVVGRIGMGGIR